MSRNVPRQPQTAQQKALGRKLMAECLAKAEKLAAQGKQAPMVWRKESGDSDDNQERGL